MTEEKGAPEGQDRREGKPDRRKGDRRKGDRRAGYDRRSGKDRRAGDRRRSLGRRKEDLELTDRRPPERRINEYVLAEDELEFINAVNEYKTKFGKPFPTWSEILHIVKSLGYEKPS